MKIVAIVGADGSGKTTQAKLLESRLAQAGFRAVCIRPTLVLLDLWKVDARVANAVSPRHQRVRIKEKKSGLSRPLGFMQIIGIFYAVLAYFYIRISKGQEDFVICDRYFYQYFFDVFAENAVKVVHFFPRPDSVIWLDMDTELLRRRHAEWNSLENEGDYLDKIVAFYREVAASSAFTRVAVLEEPKSTADEVWNALAKEVSLRPTTH